MGHHDCKCSKNNKHRQKHRCHKKCRYKKCIDRSLITQLPNGLGNATNEKLGSGRGVPADPIIAVGPKSVISMANVSLAIHRKDTMEEIFLDSTENFWNFFSGIGDVYVVYDEFSERFFLLGFFPMQISATDFITLIFVAVSKDSNPQNGDDFFKYLYEAQDIADYPKMAVDNEAVYITTQDFDGNDFVIGHTVAVFDKAPLVDGTSLPEIEPVFLKTFDPGVGFAQFIFPVQPRPSQKGKCSYEKNVEKVLLVQSIITESTPPVHSGDTLRVLQIKNVLTNPVVVFADVKVPEFRGDVDDTVPQPPPLIKPVNQPIVELEGFLDIIMSGVTADNSLWVTHSVFSDDGLDRAVARWYEIDVSKFLTENKLKLVQAGNADPGGTTNQLFPSINVNKYGDMAIQFTLVGEDQYPAIAYTGRLKDDPKGTVRLPLEVPIGDLYYQQLDRHDNNRWGDYSGLAIDPCDHKTFWLFNMYPIAVNPGIAFDITVFTDAEGVGPFDALPVFFSPEFTEVLGPGGLADPLDACSALTNDLVGQIGIAQYIGACGSSTIVPNVEAANAEATIIIDDVTPTVLFGGNPNQTKPGVSISLEDGEILLAAIEASEDPINITITAEELGPANFGSDWTTFIGAFKMDKSYHKSCKELNAPQTRNLLSIGSNSAVTTVPTVFKSKSKLIKGIPRSVPTKVSMKVTIDEEGNKKRTFTVENKSSIMNEESLR